MKCPKLSAKQKSLLIKFPHILVLIQSIYSNSFVYVGLPLHYITVSVTVSENETVLNLYVLVVMPWSKNIEPI